MAVHNPHDKFFRITFGDLDIATDFLRNYLPTNIVAQLNFSTLRLSESSFVDESLQEFRSDRLYEITTWEENPLLLYVLVEHKSYPDKWVLLQMLGYMVKIWEQTVADGAQQLRPILPIIIYHGELIWPYPTNFASYFPDHGNLYTAIIPQFTAWLKDFSAPSSEQITGDQHLRAVLLAMRRILDKNLTAEFESFISSIVDIRDNEQGLHLFKLIVYYFGIATQKVEVSEMNRILNMYDGWGAPVEGSYAHHYQMLGLEQGIEQGIEQNQQAIISVLESRFNAVSDTLHDNIVSLSDLDLLRQATVRAAISPTLAEFVAWLNEQPK